MGAPLSKVMGQPISDKWHINRKRTTPDRYSLPNKAVAVQGCKAHVVEIPGYINQNKPWLHKCVLLKNSYFCCTKWDTISTFGSFSGFTINWDKSVLLLIDIQQVDLPPCARQIKVVSSFKYLGVWVYPDIRNYLKYNLQPLLNK